MSSDQKPKLSKIFTFQTKAKVEHLKKLKEGENAILKGVLKAKGATKKEEVFVDVIDKDEFPLAIQQAVGIEIATIPTYLYTYYSIVRVPKASVIIELEEKIYAAYKKQGLADEYAKERAKELTVEIQVYANKSAAIIMSVVVEEMLHMSLSSNVMQALVGPPKLYLQSPVFPAELPGHIPEFPINLAPFSQDQLIAFLRIETPLPFVDKSEEDPDANSDTEVPYSTIGQYYCMVENCIRENFSDVEHYHKDRPQLTPNKGIYTNNTINTVYYNKYHEPQFPNSNSKGDLIKVENLWTALASLQEIVEQGEGASGGHRLDHAGKPIEGISWQDVEKDPKDKDGEGDGEISHFDKFLSLYYQHEELTDKIKRLDMTWDAQAGKVNPLTLDSIFLLPLPDNPKTANYPADLQAVSNLTNAVYTYIFVMIEDCYRKPEDTQYEVFMYGIHKSMIWILSELCNAMVNLKWRDADGKCCAPTFENYEFKSGSKPKDQLIELCGVAGVDSNGLDWVLPIVVDLPSIDVQKD